MKGFDKVEFIKTVVVKDDDSRSLEINYEPTKKLIVEIPDDYMNGVFESWRGNLNDCKSYIKELLNNGWTLIKTGIEDL